MNGMIKFYYFIIIMYWLEVLWKLGYEIIKVLNNKDIQLNDCNTINVYALWLSENGYTCISKPKLNQKINI